MEKKVKLDTLKTGDSFYYKDKKMTFCDLIPDINKVIVFNYLRVDTCKLPHNTLVTPAPELDEGLSDEYRSNFKTFKPNIKSE